MVLIFGLQLNQTQKKFFKENSIPFFNSKILHEIADKIEEIIGSHQKTEEVEEILGTSTVIVVIKYSKGNIAGCQVTSGKISRNNQVRVVRGEKEIFRGRIKNLQINKEDKLEAMKGHECGIVLNGFNDFLTGDKIIAFQIIKKNVNQT
jgi:translation initiation factor IF-2